MERNSAVKTASCLWGGIAVALLTIPALLILFKTSYGILAIGILAVVGGILFLTGCFFYVVAKGYSPIFGALSFIPVVGHLVLVLLRDKNKVFNQTEYLKWFSNLALVLPFVLSFSLSFAQKVIDRKIQESRSRQSAVDPSHKLLSALLNLQTPDKSRIIKELEDMGSSALPALGDAVVFYKGHLDTANGRETYYQIEQAIQRVQKKRARPAIVKSQPDGLTMDIYAAGEVLAGSQSTTLEKSQMLDSIRKMDKEYAQMVIKAVLRKFEYKSNTLSSEDKKIIAALNDIGQ